MSKIGKTGKTRRDLVKLGPLAAAGMLVGANNQAIAQSSPDITLDIGGKSVTIPAFKDKAFELNKELVKPDQFRSFATDPQAFVQRHGLLIDSQLSDQLKRKLQGIDSLSEARMSTDGKSEATIWAVAEGSYSTSSSKIAVAY